MSGITPLKNSATPGSGAGALFSTPASADCNAAAVERGSGNRRVNSWIISVPNTAEAVQITTIQNTDRPAIRPRVRGLRALGDANDEQRHDERDDSHLQRVQPQGPDEACRSGQRTRGRPVRGAANETRNEPKDERGQRPISAETALFLAAGPASSALNAAS